MDRVSPLSPPPTESKMRKVMSYIDEPVADAEMKRVMALSDDHAHNLLSLLPSSTSTLTHLTTSTSAATTAAPFTEPFITPVVPENIRKKFRRIDIHTHILPDNIPNFRKKFGYGDFIFLDHCTAGHKAKMMKGEKFFREVMENCYLPEARLEEMDNTGVDVQVLSTVPVMFSYWAKPRDCLEVSQFLNDHIAGICKKNPSRFVGLGTIPMQSPELAIKELERCMRELGMCGVQIASNINELPLSDPSLDEIFKRCEELGACVFIHPWDMPGEKQMEKYWLPWLVAMPMATSFAVCSLIFSGIFQRYPRLRVAFAHGGGSFPATIGRVEHGFRCRPDLCAIDNKINPRHYLGKFWVDSLIHDSEVFTYVANLVGVEKVCLGSDYPFPLGEIATEYTPEQRPGRLIEISDFSDAQKANMLWENALNFLGITSERFDLKPPYASYASSITSTPPTTTPTTTSSTSLSTVVAAHSGSAQKPKRKTSTIPEADPKRKVDPLA